MGPVVLLFYILISIIDKVTGLRIICFICSWTSMINSKLFKWVLGITHTFFQSVLTSNQIIKSVFTDNQSTLNLWSR